MTISPSVRLICVVLAAAAPWPGAARSQTLEARLLKEQPAALARAARTQGDPVRGAILFYQPQLSCTKCHSCGDKESPLGPDLARPASDSTDVYIVESLLAPSKVIRKGFETVIVTRTDGRTVTGLLAEDRKDALVIRDPAAGGQPVVVAKGDIESRSVGTTSLMPAGLVNQLADRQQFLDVVSYLIESAEFGPARARSLRPDPTVINPPLPAYEADLDHVGLIASLDAAALRRGERLYLRLCASCHGTKDEPGSMPTAPRFADIKFKNGSDLLSMYRTLTLGYGMMAAQSTLVPRQKYELVHYVRETFLKPSNPTQYVGIDAAYLTKLPKGASRGPTPPEAEPWRKADYGPTLTGTFEVGTGGNIAYKGIAIRLDPGAGGVAAGNAWMLFEHDTLRMAAAWTGRGFIDWNGINFNGRHEVHPRIVGRVECETVGLGWADPATGSFIDTRLRGRDGKPYGPLPRAWGRYRGLYQAGDRVVFSYSVGDTQVLESPGLLGSGNDPVFSRTFNLGPRQADMTVRVARRADGKLGRADLRVERQGPDSVVVLAGAADDGGRLQAGGVVGGPNRSHWATDDDGHLLFHIPAGGAPVRFTIWAARIAAGARATNVGEAVAIKAKPVFLTPLIRSEPPRWRDAVSTRGEVGTSDGPFAVDSLSLPAANPWACQLRLTGLDFLGGGKSAAVCTWDGDVWRVYGLDHPDLKLTWRRIASGLFQPLGLKVVNGQIYVTCRDQIVILRDLDGAGEAAFYECFNSDHQVTEHFHEFAMGLQTDAAGNFYYAKAARHGKPALVPQHGTLLRISPDGSRTDILATGFRATNGVCLNSDGSFFLTDQEGHWIPKNRINWVRPDGKFFGNMWGYSNVTDTSDAAMGQPVCWITNRFDRSPAELLWVRSKSWGALGSKSWGALDGSLLNLSYGHGKVYVVPHETVGGAMQGGMVALPLPPFPTGIMRGRFNPGDGHLYVCGMYAWAGNQQAPGGLYRIRATGRPAHLPVGYHVTKNGLALTFSDTLAPESVADLKNFGLKVWDLQRSANYGSPHLNEHALTVTRAALAADGRTLTLEVPGLKPTWGLELWYSVVAADGREVDGLLHGSIHRMGD
jgi:putative heme-binding domain-containing protein